MEPSYVATSTNTERCAGRLALGAWLLALNDMDKLNTERLPWSPKVVRMRHHYQALSSQ